MLPCTCVDFSCLSLSLQKKKKVDRTLGSTLEVLQVHRFHQVSVYPSTCVPSANRFCIRVIDLHYERSMLDHVRWTRRLTHHLRQELTKLSDFHRRNIDGIFLKMSNLFLRSVLDTGYVSITSSGICHVALCDFGSKELFTCRAFRTLRLHQTIFVKCMSTHTRDNSKSRGSKQECHVCTWYLFLFVVSDKNGIYYTLRTTRRGIALLLFQDNPHPLWIQSIQLLFCFGERNDDILRNLRFSS